MVTRSRDFTRRALTAWHWLPPEADEDRQAADDVLLLVSEVVSNACLHGGGPTALVLDCTHERLRIEVTDANPAPPVPLAGRLSRPARPGGYGLLIVERLARDWGCRPGAGGKCVWVEVPCPAPVRRGCGAAR
ncbi:MULTISPECIES: ATP-binding protein [unclassified Streptomyces]|uniref:ATP-binding protein n=1 Tax=unclassified Streptomyces TaxID=2593676 RepID=UPI00224E3DE0|nr:MULTISPECIES: ATP-binding protein [unclassified Streptomyces]MCX4524613.1 ATP-binding protein [Streptomyces sp. NBC_01551]MCX4544863.1 ATP-binding protein [Streptomyces sp. NBC_01565]